MISTSPWVDDKEHLQEILAREEFNLPQGSGENWIQRAVEYVIELIAELFQWTHIPSGAANTVSTLVLILAVLGLVGIIYWLFRRMIWEQKKHRPLFMDGEKYVLMQTICVMRKKKQREENGGKENARCFWRCWFICK